MKQVTASSYCSRKRRDTIASRKCRVPRFSVYQLGRGSEPVMVVGRMMSLVARYMEVLPDFLLRASIGERRRKSNAHASGTRSACAMVPVRAKRPGSHDRLCAPLPGPRHYRIAIAWPTSPPKPASSPREPARAPGGRALAGDLRAMCSRSSWCSALWEIVARAGVFPPKLFPSLVTVAEAFVDLTIAGHPAASRVRHRAAAARRASSSRRWSASRSAS